MKIYKYEENENTSINEMICHEVIKSIPKKILLSGGATHGILLKIFAENKKANIW